MDEGYDQVKAADALERISLDRISNPFTNLHLSEVIKTASWTSQYEPIKGGVPCVWRLTVLPEGAVDRAASEEVVVTIQGIICKKDLPPFQEKIRHSSPSSAHAKHLRQSVTLTGLHTRTFESAIRSLTEIHALFGRSVGQDNLAQCGIIGQHKDQPALEISNRYFTPKKDAINAEAVGFSVDEDPQGFLQKAAGSSLVHIDENIVCYYERIISEVTGDSRFVTIKPIKFQVGDIVEAQASIILIPLREKKFKSTMILRSLTLMDGSFTQRAATTRLTLKRSSVLPAISLKRRVGYEEEETSMTRSKMSRMLIDNEEPEGTARHHHIDQQIPSGNDLD